MIDRMERDIVGFLTRVRGREESCVHRTRLCQLYDKHCFFICNSKSLKL